MGAASLHLLRTQVQCGWRRDHAPVLTVPSGTELSVETADASGGQLHPNWVVSAFLPKHLFT